MTCIVGIAENGKVYLAGDSAGVDGRWESVERADKKVFKNGDFIFGFTSSFRMGQILQYAFTPPFHNPNKSDMSYMTTDFVNGVRDALKDCGYAKVESNQESGGTFLVGYRGNLYAIYDDYQVGIAACGYDAVGCGDSHARGALYATKGQHVSDRLTTALSAASYHSAGVRPPFNFIEN